LEVAKVKTTKRRGENGRFKNSIVRLVYEYRSRGGSPEVDKEEAKEISILPNNQKDKTCKYVFLDGRRCRGIAYKGGYCILHVDLSKYENTKYYWKLVDLKYDKIKEKRGKGDFNYEGASLYDVDFSSSKPQFLARDLNFMRAKIVGDAKFDKAIITGNVLFNGAKVGKSVSFKEAEINGSIQFVGSRIGVGIYFINSKIHMKTKRDYFSACSRLGEVLSFKGATFDDHGWEVQACRAARVTLEEHGWTTDADDHFFREMSAKRKARKRWIWRNLEFLTIEWGIGYGVRWKRVLFRPWLPMFGFYFVLYIFVGILLQGASLSIALLISSLEISVFGGVALGFGFIYPVQGALKWFLLSEAFLGTLVWGAIIATITRRFMR
jgi:hypothetical protein